MDTSSSGNTVKIDPEVLEIQKKLYRENLIHQASLKHGSKYFPICLEPFQHERDRLALNFTANDRVARKQYLADQILTDREPVNVPEWTRVNIFRRMYRKPYDALTNLVRPLIGDHRSWYFRRAVPKVTALVVFSWLLWYRVKYCDNWEKRARAFKSRTLKKPVLLPGQAGYPDSSRMVPEFGMEGFDQRTALRGEKLVTSGY
ncbi:unnamed protein product [Trichobilharzia szidati]|nr:unnamed protein product [Trichobilharzia szidati]